MFIVLVVSSQMTLHLAPGHVFVFVTLIISLARVRVAVLDNELERAGEGGCHGARVFRESDECVAGGWLVVDELCDWNVANHFEVVCVLHVYRYVLQHLVVKRICAVELNTKPSNNIVHACSKSCRSGPGER